MPAGRRRAGDRQLRRQTSADPCAGRPACRRSSSAAQMFALADNLAAQGDLAGAAGAARSADPGPASRASRRSAVPARRACARKLGDLQGAAQAFAICWPSSRAPIPRGWSWRGSCRAWARPRRREAELAAAEASAYRPRSSRTSAASRARSDDQAARPHRRADRGTGFEHQPLDLAACSSTRSSRRSSSTPTRGGKAALGFTRQRARLFARPHRRSDLLSNAGVARRSFDQAALQRHPVRARQRAANATRQGAAPPCRRCMSGAGSAAIPYSTGFGGQVELLTPLGAATQLGLSGSRVRQKIATNPDQDGWRTALSADLTRALGAGDTARVSLRYAPLDARGRTGKPAPDRRRDCCSRSGWRPLTLFGEVDYTRTHGHRADVPVRQDAPRPAHGISSAGAIFNRVSCRRLLAVDARDAQRQPAPTSCSTITAAPGSTSG